MIRISILDVDVGIASDEQRAIAKALTHQIIRDFAPHWYVEAEVGVGVQSITDWQLQLLLQPDQQGALGYHDLTPMGRPILKVFPRLDALDGVPWSVTASHEVLETLADPRLCRGAQALDGRWWALEVCDAVEKDTYKVDGVDVSNFVLPSYFEPPKDPRGAAFDFCGLLRKPLELRPGGYGQWWDPARGWQTTTNGDLRAARAAMAAHGRGARRCSRP